MGPTCHRHGSRWTGSTEPRGAGAGGPCHTSSHVSARAEVALTWRWCGATVACHVGKGGAGAGTEGRRRYGARRRAAKVCEERGGDGEHGALTHMTRRRRRWPATRKKRRRGCGRRRSRGSGDPPAMWMRARGRRRRGDADGGGGEDAASSTAALEAAERVAAVGGKTRIPASRRG